jgi:hypothetical protein
MGFSWSRFRCSVSHACPRVRLRLGDERGAVAVLVAGMMVVILGMSAMAIDFGWWWSNQRHLQTQADAAAWAGAETLLTNPTNCPGTVTTVADQYAAPNTTTAGGMGASQSLDCDNSSSTSGTAGGNHMETLEENGCPTTQISASSTRCSTTTPPSCLPEFTGVDEGLYDVGEVFRFENGYANGAQPGPTCNKPNGPPVSTDYWPLLPTVKPNDPRLITIFVVPNNRRPAAAAPAAAAPDPPPARVPRPTLRRPTA